MNIITNCQTAYKLLYPLLPSWTQQPHRELVAKTLLDPSFQKDEDELISNEQRKEGYPFGTRARHNLICCANVPL